MPSTFTRAWNLARLVHLGVEDNMEPTFTNGGKKTETYMDMSAVAAAAVGVSGGGFYSYFGNSARDGGGTHSAMRWLSMGTSESYTLTKSLSQSSSRLKVSNSSLTT